MLASWTNVPDQPQKLRNEIAFTEFSLRYKFVFADDRNPNQSLSSTLTKRVSIRSVM